MTVTKSMDEVHQEHIDVLGADLGTAFSALHQRLVELHIVWQQYEQLFGSDESTVELLNRTSGLFFKVVQDELWDSVLLGISRMTDPPATGKKKNLTINSLPPLIEDLDLKSLLEGLCRLAAEEASFAREHRNKRIAHQDHNYATKQEANALNGISRLRVNAMLKAISDVLNLIHLRFWDTTYFYHDFVDLDGARVLVAKLRSAELKGGFSRAP